MTQQIINLGAAPDDGQGDNLRTAFDKTNENFDQIWTAGPVGSNVQISGNTIATLQVNQDLALSPNGTGNIRLNNNTIPGANNTWFLGSATYQWRGVYANSITAGNVTINDNLVVPGNATIGGNLTVEGDTIQIGNIVTDTKTIQLSNTAANGSQANGSGITVGANDNIATLLYNSTSNVWTTNIGITATGNVTAPYFIGNGALLTGIVTSSYANANAVAYGESGWAGNIIPNGNAVYSLGNSTNQWNDLYVSNTTIFMNNVPITLGAGNVLSVNGNAVLQNNSNSTITTTGNITAGYLFGNGSQLTGINVSTSSISNGTSNVNIATANGPVTVSYAGSGNTWTFGDVNVPEALYWPDGSFQATAFVGIAQDLANPGNATITSNSTGNTTYAWNFGTDGRLTFPGTPRIDTGSDNFEVQAAENISFEANAVVNIYTDTSGTTYQWQFGDSGDLSVPGDVQFANGSIITDNLEATGDFGISTAANVGFMIDTNEAAHTWTFDTTGNLNLPTNGSINFDAGGIVQAVDEDFSIRVQDADDDGFALLLQVDDGAGAVLGSTELQRDSFSIQFAGGGAPQFRFDENGVTQLPGNVRWDTYADQSLYAVSDNSENGSIELKTISYASDTLGSNIRVSQSNATISTSNALYTWNFDYNGNLNLPLSGNIVGTTPNNNGYLTWFGNSSGDLNGYTTLRLVPDDTLVNNDQYLILDPTSPGHIHIRAGGTQDNSFADLFLGGENSYFKVNSGANSEVVVASNNYSWTFDPTGVLTLPGDANNSQSSEITSVGNSSGDGNGYATLQLKPDSNVGGDSYLIIDPTAPNHIHIRAGGTQDNSGAQLYLGGENSYFLVENGANANVYVASNSNQWKFDTTGILTLPGEGVLQSVNDTVTLVSLNTTTGNANSVYLGSGGGLGFNDQEIGGNWLEIFRSGTEPEIRVPVGRGNLNIQTAEGANVYNWLFDNTGNLTLPTDGYLVVTTGIIGSGASPAPSLSGFSSIATTGSPGNISASGNLLVSGYANITGNINGSNATFSGNISGNTAGFAIGYRDIPQVAFTANATIAIGDAGKHFYSTQSTDYILTIANNVSQAFQTGAAITIVNQGTGNITVAQGTGVTLYLAGNATAGNRTISTFGMATCIKVATDTWFINGTGVS